MNDFAKTCLGRWEIEKLLWSQSSLTSASPTNGRVEGNLRILMFSIIYGQKQQQQKTQLSQYSYVHKQNGQAFNCVDFRLVRNHGHFISDEHNYARHILQQL